MADRGERSPRARGLGGAPLGGESPLLGGAVAEEDGRLADAFNASAGAEHSRDRGDGYDPRADDYATPEIPAPMQANLPDLRALLPASDEERALDDWGRSERFLTRIPMGRYGEPDELVGPVVFLGSAMSSYVTGTTVVVDGGYLAL